jgi:hypothetical protein
VVLPAVAGFLLALHLALIELSAEWRRPIVVCVRPAAPAGRRAISDPAASDPAASVPATKRRRTRFMTTSPAPIPDGGAPGVVRFAGALRSVQLTAQHRYLCSRL